MQRIPVGLVGVAGYTGMELCRLLAAHPELELVRVTSRTEAGKTLGQILPHLHETGLAELVVTAPDTQDLAQACKLVFLAVPHGTAMDLAADLLRKNVRVVDLSADFRLRDPETYSQWYNLDHRHVSLLEQAVYGLPELYGKEIAGANLVANPGCYPTSVLLALAPALHHELVNPEDILVDSKSGATGAGRKPSTATLFCEVQDNFRAYSLGRHRHTPEMEQEIGVLSGQQVQLSFTPHLLPIGRGILSTIYARLKTTASSEEVHALYRDYYAQSPVSARWVRIQTPGVWPETRFVRGTMYCDLGLLVDQRTKRLLIVSVIDNLCRGASGQALANANLMLGLAPDMGLPVAPMVP
ncbi:N-acetyl-gamma-glutamyl-phosphate reductase [Desulfonatronum thiosulfatophilum]|uniref:N-acetyl-gamma-glutamyl-phosphate reductase n=1 Tax=Desulfonatronum thiosulfatophilum TaxID=617002 RepID=A0A1G6B9E8_9BACT|nr:N-acetyl-gamma-glutamyl-phosphate reductase [Desulfonatronum thiosulfatophilum]SDB17247.1 N-acetyl-gamma-glutamyl-phosphate reductase [Desulfonatronum thiosulfatophilum]